MQEALAIKWAVGELCYYLADRPFTLVTDHAPLQWMTKAKDRNSSITEWFLALHDFVIGPAPGTAMQMTCPTATPVGPVFGRV